MNKPCSHRHAVSRFFFGVTGALALAALLSTVGIAPALAQAAPSAPPANVATANVPASGLPPIDHFDASTYGGSPQNWAVTQDSNGLIYVGNADSGVLSFDGARWQRIRVPNNSIVRSLATGRDGRIYVGTLGDFGYLQPDATGALHYVSLLDQVPKDARDFADVWRVYVDGDDVYFSTFNEIFRLRAGHITVIKPKTRFHLSFMVGGTLYVREVGEGLMRLVGDQLQLLPGTQRFANDRIYAILPWHGPGAKPGELLIGTDTQGWFRYVNGKLATWHTDADAEMNAAAVYSAIWLADGRLAVATLRNGLFVLDASGHVQLHLDQTNGLSTDMVLALCQDRQGGLWIATGNGVTRIQLDAPLTYLGKLSGLHGATLDAIRHDGVLYAATDDGVLKLVVAPDGAAHFQKLPGAAGQDWAFAEVDSQLLVAGNDGVFSIQDDGSTRQLLDPKHTGHVLRAEALWHSRTQPARVFVGLQDGLSTLRWSDNHWIDEGRVAGLTDETRTIAQDAAGHIWLGLWQGGVDRLTLPDNWQGPSDPRAVKIEHFDTSAGLPPGQQQVILIDGHVKFATANGIYLFNDSNGQFELDPAFANLFPDGPRAIAAARQTRDGTLWLFVENSRNDVKQSGRAVRVDGKWQWRLTPLQSLTGKVMLFFYGDTDGATWLGGYEGLYRFDPARKPHDATQFTARVRSVTTHDGHALSLTRQGQQDTRVPYAGNALRFEFSLASYDDIATNQYQVLLQGVDPGWSPWTTDAFRDYTNLHEGSYVFRVRARNIYGKVSKEGTFDFSVLPPWYRTWWAWLLWVASAVVVVGLFLRWRSAILRHRNRELAALVELRTAELAQANDALQESNKKLAEQSVTDPLTGLKNRRYLYDHIARDIAAARRHCADRRRDQGEAPANSNILFMMVDVDHFKEINDAYGHAAGDRILQQIRDILMESIRETDIPVRWGGEEFLIVARFTLPDAGPTFAERIRTAVANRPFDIGEGRVVHRTCSIGFASYPASDDAPDHLSWEHVVAVADECMYAAKDNGRNAWAGVLPGPLPPEGELLDVLRAALAALPKIGAMPITASWTQTATVAVDADTV